MTNKICFGIIISIGLTFSGCKSFTKVPPIPLETMNPSEELHYIHSTDQLDRRRTLFTWLFSSSEKVLKNKRIVAMNLRDSIRLSRVINLYKNDLVKTPDDKFHAAYTYFHGGETKMGPDSLYLRIAYELFSDLAENGLTKKDKKRGDYYKPILLKYWKEEVEYQNNKSIK